MWTFFFFKRETKFSLEKKLVQRDVKLKRNFEVLHQSNNKKTKRPLKLFLLDTHHVTLTMTLSLLRG